MIIGIVVIAMLLLYGRGVALAVIFFVLLIGTLLINLRVLGVPLNFVMWFEQRFERTGAKLPGWGSACYAIGTLIIVSFLSDINQIAAIIFILAIGDGISTIIGRYGRIKIPYNKKKTIEGSVAFFISSLGCFYFIGAIALPLALVGMIAESLPAEDNLTIPIACTFFMVMI